MAAGADDRLRLDCAADRLAIRDLRLEVTGDTATGTRTWILPISIPTPAATVAD